MCSLCREQEESIDHVYFIWSWLQNIFPDVNNFSCSGFITFLKSPDSPIIKRIKLVAITFSLWMIWRMMNHTRFQQCISMVCIIHLVKDCIRILGNRSKKRMSNQMDDFTVLKFFGISTRLGKVYVPVQVYSNFPHVGWTKVNIDGAAQGSSFRPCCLWEYLHRESREIYWWFFYFFGES